MPQDRADLTVLRAIERDVLDGDVVDAALAFALRELTPSDDVGIARRDELKAELVRIEAELARYADAVADAGPLEAILQTLKVREQRREAIVTELKVLAPQKPREIDVARIRATLRAT